jgi:carbamoyltransferase
MFGWRGSTELVANGKIENSGLFKNIFIQPAAGDAGGALGAALAAHHIYFEKQRNTDDINENYFLGHLLLMMK